MSKVTELLDDYTFWDDMVRKKRRELDRQRDRRTSIKITYSDTPGGGDPQTLADYMAERDELEQDLEAYKEKRFAAYSQIMRLAFKLRSRKQFDIIYRRDICRSSWSKICRDLDVTRSSAVGLHNRAIRSMEEIDAGT